MRYDPELYYFYDQRGLPFEKAVLVTAMKVGEWCTHYKAKLICPAKGAKKSERQGSLPSEAQEKLTFIDDLVRWLLSNSRPQDLFALFLDDVEIGQRRGDEPGKFNHHDDTCCWGLDLTEQQFQELQQAWKQHELPEDLFYQEGKDIRVAEPPGFIGKFLIRLGGTSWSGKIYTPKRWEEKQREESAAKGKNNC